MFQKPTQVYKRYFFLQLAFLLFYSASLFSQSVSAPTFAGPLNFCVTSGSTLNTFTFQFSSTGFSANNTFVLQMSDATGNFDSPVIPTVQDTAVYSNSSSNSLTLTVLPTFIGGDGYRFRVVNTTASLIGDPSLPVSIYYIAYANSFYINANKSFATICDSNGITLKVDDPSIPAATLPNLRFKWFRSVAGIPTQISGETGTSLLVTSQGNYFAQLNYGTCFGSTSAFASQSVSVNFYTTGGTYLITSSNGDVVAPGVPTTLSLNTGSTPGLTYQWFNQDTGIIAGETNFSYITDKPGTYYLAVNDGTCPTKSNSLTLKLINFVSAASTIPNLVSPNNDGDNDKWEIPSNLTVDNKSPSVLILDSKGIIAFQSDNYLNNWPDETIDFDTINPVYYYIITTKSGEVKKGSITIVK